MMRDNPTEPVVGMLATYGIGADAYAMVITKVSPSGHRVEALHLKDENDPTSTGDPTFVRVFTRRKNGTYRPLGASNYGYLALGHARNYRDPSF